MKRISLLVLFLAILLGLMALASPQTVMANTSGTPVPVYVNSTRTDGNEDGSTTHPYTSLDEGIAYGQAQPSGGRIYVLQADGSWRDYGKYGPVTAGAGGSALPASTLYFLLATVAVILILAGRHLQRRSKQTQN